jgi:protein-disulfide isomerase
MKKFLLTTTLISTAFIGSAMAQGMNKSQIEAIIKDYIQNNPEVILDSVEEYGRAQQEVSQADRQKAVDENIGWVMNNDTLPVAGNADGDVTVVEFYDYNCGYCKKAMADVTTLIEEDKNVKVVFVEMPILGRTSELAARWALAAEAQGAFLPYHIALMNNRGPITEDTLEKIAKNNNLDIAEMRKYADSDKVTAMIAEKSAKASEMGISGTPAFIIDGQLYGGYIGLDAMKEAVKEAREG